MMTLPAPLRAWYGGLAPRERRLVVIGGVVFLLLIIYLAIVSPVGSAYGRLTRDVQAKRQLLTYINQAAVRLQADSADHIGKLPADQSVLAATSAAIQSSPISGAVQRLEQTQTGGVRLSLSSVGFDDLARWLNTLASQDGIVVTHATIEQAADPGTVDATLTLDSHS
ncbi:MAG: type II secretion system protein GspM [Gammaproteobacteria bacterium]